MTYKSIFDNTLFANQVILVTGGGSGIGRCVAFELASLMKGSRGGVIVVAGRKAAKLEKTRSDILSSMSSLLIKIDCVSLNIRDSVAVNAAIQGIVDRHGRIDGVVNNAGGQFVSPAENITDKGWNA